MSAIHCCLFSTGALHLNCSLELLLALLNCRVTHSCDFLASHLAEEVLCDLLAQHTHTGCVTPAAWLCGDTVAPRVDAPWLQLAQVPLAGSWLLNLPSGVFVAQPAPCPCSIWLLSVAGGRALALLSRILKLFWEAWEVFENWFQSAEDRKSKAKGLSATKSNRLSF